MPPKSFSGAAVFRSLGCAQKTVLFRKNQIIFSHGDSSESLFYITKGTVKLTLTSALGKEAVIGFLGTGDFIGESCLCSNTPTRFHTATALTALSTVKIDRMAILHCLRAHAESALLLIAYLVRRNQQIQEDFVEMLLSSSEQRLARVLSRLRGLGRTNEEKPGPKVTQQDLANMLGITRQRVNFLMKRLRR